MIANDGRAYVGRKLAEWIALRDGIAAIEKAEHPDFTDKYGRVWTWEHDDVYSHDETLAFPFDMIGDLGLPRPECADNPNYAKLCVICRAEWSA